MTWLKIYEREREKFPEFWNHNIYRKDVMRILRSLSNYFGIYQRLSKAIPFKRIIVVRYVMRDGVGKAFCHNIDLPKKEPFPISLLLHEFAHLLNGRLYGRVCTHRGRFWDCLCRVYRIAKEKNYLDKYKEKDQLENNCV